MEEPAQAVPALERVSDVLGELGGTRQAVELGLEPGPQGVHDRRREFLPHLQPVLRRMAAHHGLDPVQRPDPFEDLLAHGRGRAALELDEASSPVGPAVGKHPWAGGLTRIAECVVHPVAVDMQRAAAGVALHQLQSDLGAPVARMMEHDDRRVGAAIAALIAGDRPQIVEARLAGARRQHRHRGLVHEQAVRRLEVVDHPVDDRGQHLHSAPGPVAQHGAVEIDPLAPVGLGLTVERLVIGELRDQRVRHQRLARKAARHQMLRRWRLGALLALAGAADVLRPDRDQHPQLGRHDVETLGAILADLGHRAAAAGALRALRLDYLLGARQVLGQLAEIAVGRRRFAPLLAGRRVGLLLGRGQHPLGDRDVLEQGQPVLLGMALLGARAPGGVVQRGDHPFQAFARLLGRRERIFGCLAACAFFLQLGLGGRQTALQIAHGKVESHAG